MRAPLLAAVAATVAVSLVPSAQAAAKRPTRDVLVVSNNWAGTADLVDAHSFKPRRIPADLLQETTT